MAKVDPSASLRSIILQQRRHNHPNTEALLFLLSRGANPMVPDEKGVSILEDLCDHQSPSGYAGNARALILCALVKKGANPLVYADRFVSMFNYSTGIGNSVLRAMSVREEEAPCRDESNRNPLHLIIRAHNSWRETRQHLQAIHQSPLHPQWLDAGDNDGRTPIHSLWSAPTNTLEAARVAWALTDTLAKAGGDFFRPDIEGQRPLDLILRALDAGFPSPEESCAYVAPLLASLKAQDLHRATHPVERAWVMSRL